MPYGTPPSQKHVHMCMFLRIAQILIQFRSSNLATTAPEATLCPERPLLPHSPTTPILLNRSCQPHQCLHLHIIFLCSAGQPGRLVDVLVVFDIQHCRTTPRNLHLPRSSSISGRRPMNVSHSTIALEPTKNLDV